MQEPQEKPLGPPVKAPDKSVRYPYQEQKEQWGNKKFDTLIVFGQGPVKGIIRKQDLDLLSQKWAELSPKQRKDWGLDENLNPSNQWSNFLTDPLHSVEPTFRIVNDDKERQKWQNMGRTGLNRWGRENALAAGYALYLGITDQLILSGGETKPKWLKELFPQYLQDWPSEAKLMKQLIKQRFGELYEKTYGKPIDEAIIIEDASEKTPENLMKSLASDPDLMEKKHVGFLAANFQVLRSELTARLFTLPVETRGKLSAQEILKEVAETRKNKPVYKGMLDYMVDNLNNPDYRDRVTAELRYILSLTNEKYVSNWIGYLVDDERLEITQKVLRALAKNPNWLKASQEAFQKVGLNFDSFSKEIKPEEAPRLKEGLREIKNKYRVMAPDLKDI